MSCLDAETEANHNGRTYIGCPSGPNLNRTADVGSYPANPWGLFDMHGNVYEWCNDWYNYGYNGDETDPVGAESGSTRVLRGGSWGDGGADFCRSASRFWGTPNYTDNKKGFRPVRSIP